MSSTNKPDVCGATHYLVVRDLPPNHVITRPNLSRKCHYLAYYANGKRLHTVMSIRAMPRHGTPLIKVALTVDVTER